MSEVAKMLGVSSRTLQNWKKEVKIEKQTGRPGAETNLDEMILIAREWKKQGYKGSRPVIKALPWIRVRLVREVISKLKLRRRSRYQKKRTSARLSVISLQAGVLHVLDGAITSKKEKLIIGKDRSSQLITVKKIDGKFDTKKTIDYFEELHYSTGLPLVVATDNGSQFCSKEVTDYLERRKVIHLRSLPRTPQHNGACEIAVREFKETLEATKDLSKTLTSLNECLKRKQLGYRTASEVDREKRVQYSEEDRARLYEEAKKAVRQKIYGLKVARNIRKAEREAIMETLESFKLIKLNRGNQTSIMKTENIT